MISGAAQITISRSDAANQDLAAYFDQLANKVNPDDTIVVNGVEYTYARWSDLRNQLKQTFIAQSSSNQSPSEEQAKNQRVQIHDIYRQSVDAKKTLDDLKKTPNVDQSKIDAAEKNFKNLREILQNNIRQFQTINEQLSTKTNPISAEILKFAEHSEGAGDAKAQVVMQNGGGTAAGGGQTAAKSMYAGGTGFMPPTTWAAQTASPTFSTSAYMQSSMMEGSILNSFDAVLQNQNKGKQLMMLFFYFARMAESGDMGAMYQFMKFLTFIISKDKAKQQIDMGKKLIELQDYSRKWTDKLLGMQTNANDPNSSNDFMKVMTQVKSETDAIATSQKLISQMMEEFSQIVETLTNSTKAALDANGRILRVVSSRGG